MTNRNAIIREMRFYIFCNFFEAVFHTVFLTQGAGWIKGRVFTDGVTSAGSLAIYMDNESVDQIMVLHIDG